MFEIEVEPIYHIIWSRLCKDFQRVAQVESAVYSYTSEAYIILWIFLGYAKAYCLPSLHFGHTTSIITNRNYIRVYKQLYLITLCIDSILDIFSKGIQCIAVETAC